MQGKNILTINEKYYVADHGLRSVVYGQGRSDIDQVLENIVYMELLRRGYKVTVRRKGEKELDFVAHKNVEKLYVQVCYLFTDEDTV